MGFIIDNPEPPTAIEGLGQSLNVLGNTYMQKKMADLERKRKMEDELKLLREKAKIEQESPLFRTEQGTKVLGAAGQMNIDPREAASMLGYNPDELFPGTKIPSISTNISPAISTQPMEKPVFGGGVQPPTQPTFGGQPKLTVKSYEQKMGRLQPKDIIDIEGVAQEEIGKKKAEFVADLSKSKATNLYNLNLVADSARDLSQWLVEGYKEGGAGNIYKAGLTSVAAKGFLPEDMASKFSKSGSIVGKRTEMLMKMFPLLTQQLGKEGSIRLIESVLARIGQTLPDTFTPPAMAREQMAGTLQSLYRVQRAMETIDLSQVDFSNPNNLDNFSKQVAYQSSRIPIVGEEMEVLKGMINTAVEPLNDYIGGEFNFGGREAVFGERRNVRNFNSEADAEAANLPSGTKITINGRPAIITEDDR